MNKRENGKNERIKGERGREGMIILRLYSDDETDFRRVVGYYKDQFYNLLDPWLDEEEKPPFRDPESLRLLKESYGVTFVNDDDWYSVIAENRRMSISCLYEGIKFALAAVHCSRQGRYLRYWEATEKIWKVLADMPFDILLAVPVGEINIFSCITEGADCKLINFPYQNQRIEVNIKSHCFERDDFYEAVSDDDECSPGSWLYRGKDGKYYMDRFGAGYALQYYWKKDIEGIIKYAEQKNEGRIYLARIHQTYNIYELGEILKKDDNSILYPDYFFHKHMYDRMYQEGELDEQELQAAISELQESEEYKEYLYFRDTFRVISHLETVPPDCLSRKLPILMVDKNRDGTYFIHGTLTCKYPEFDELLHEMISMRNSDRECYALIVDVDELLFSVEDMKNTVCGFKVMADSLEIFDKKEGLRVFGEMLWEARDSGRCTVSKEFY